MHPPYSNTSFEYLGERGGDAWFASTYSDGQTREFRMPRESVPFASQDFTLDYRDTPLTGDPYVDELITNGGEFLGKGHQGLVYRVGDKAVKVYSTLPFHIDHHEHRTPADALKTASQEFQAHIALQGLPCIPDVDFVQADNDRVFVVKPLITELHEPNQEQYEQIEACLRGIHKRGWTVSDNIEVGLDEHGRPLLFDLGFAAQGGDRDDRKEDRTTLRYWPRNRKDLHMDKTASMTDEDLLHHAVEAAESVLEWLDDEEMVDLMAVEIEEALALVTAARRRLQDKLGRKHPDVIVLKSYWQALTEF